MEGAFLAPLYWTQWSDNVVFISAAQQSESLYLCPLFFRLCLYIGHYRVFRSIPSAI